MNLTNQPVRQKQPKPKRSRAHISFIKSLPCLCCDAPAPTQAHHVRVGAYQLGKRQCDSRCVPLCARHHRILHNMNESCFWGDLDIDPLFVAGSLWAVSPDVEKGRLIVLQPDARIG